MADGDRHDLPCWTCGGDSCTSLFLEDEPHLHCFKCGQQNWDKEVVERYLTMDSQLLQLKSNKQTDNITTPFPYKGIINPLHHRGINQETAEKYGVLSLFQGESETPYSFAFPSFSEDNEFIAQKIKRLDKKMKWSGRPTGAKMFGQQLFPSGGKYLTITEGEEDAMAAYQMLKARSKGFETAVISLSYGAGSAEKECKKQWEYINSFENIILAFDGDEPGQKAARKISKLFEYRPKVMLFGEAKKTDDGWINKDANDYLLNGKEADFHNMWWRAEKVSPKGVLPFSNLWDAMTSKDTSITVEYPWKGLNDFTCGLHTGELVVIKAHPKIGKTALLREIAYHIRTTSPYNVGLLFLEDTKKSIGMGMCGLHLNKPIQFPDIPVTMDELKESHAFLSEEDRLVVFDPEDERTSENVINKIKYFVKARDCKFIILDHITMLAYQNEGQDERRYLDKLTADLKTLTTSLDVCIVIVTHVNDDGKTRGTRAPVQLCNTLINLERDKENPDEVVANTTHVSIEENRGMGLCGIAAHLYFDRVTGRMTEIDPDLRNEGFDEPRQVEFGK